LVKTMLSDDAGEFFLSKVPKFLHMVINVIEENCCVFLLLVFALFLSYNICKNTWLFLAASLGVYLLNKSQMKGLILSKLTDLDFSHSFAHRWKKVSL